MKLPKDNTNTAILIFLFQNEIFLIKCSELPKDNNVSGHTILKLNSVGQHCVLVYIVCLYRNVTNRDKIKSIQVNQHLKSEEKGTKYCL